MILSRYIAISAVAVSTALGAANADQTVSDIQAVHEKIAIARKCLDSYNGGIADAVMVGKSLYDIHKATEIARRNLDASHQFSSEDGEKVIAAFHGMHKDAVESMRLASDKASHFQGAGVSFVGRSLLNQMHEEKRSFDKALKKRVPSEHHNRIAPSQDEMSLAFEDTLNAFTA